MQKFKAMVKIWVIIQLVKRLEVSPRHPRRHKILEEEVLDEVLVLLRTNREEVVGYGLN
jgi:hypothetical protein